MTAPWSHREECHVRLRKQRGPRLAEAGHVTGSQAEFPRQLEAEAATGRIASSQKNRDEGAGGDKQASARLGKPFQRHPGLAWATRGVPQGNDDGYSGLDDRNEAVWWGQTVASARGGAWKKKEAFFFSTVSSCPLFFACMCLCLCERARARYC